MFFDVSTGKNAFIELREALPMKTEIISVPDISCHHCKMAIEGALKKNTGISNAEVAVADKTVTVVYDENKLSHIDVVRTIEDEWYSVKE
jgi:copper chaperone